MSVAAPDVQVPEDSASSHPRRTAGRPAPAWLRPGVLVLGALVAFFVHFRPWEIAFLEEWPLAEFWMAQGPVAFFAHYGEWSLSRPLHLVPTAIGLGLTGGAPGGIYLILGLVAAAQFLVVVWALRPLRRPFWLTAAIALVIALHPLWPGGLLQRFLPAQTAALGMLVAAGFLIRWLLRGRIRSLVGVAVSIVLGLLVYPGPAVAAMMVAVALALVISTSWRRRIIGVAVMLAGCALATAYSLVISRLISPGAATYEAGNFAAGTTATPRQLVTYVLSVLTTQGEVVLIGILLVALLGPILSLTGVVSARAGWLVTGAALASPAAAAVFFGNTAWLQDIERIGYATSLGLVAALLIWGATAEPVRIRLQAVAAAILAVLAVAGAVRGVVHWQPSILLQHQLFAELAPVVEEAEGDEIVVVVDHSATYGTEYTLPQFYISSASHVVNGDDTRVWLCSMPEDPPLAAAGVCDPADIGDDPRLVDSFAVPHGTVDLYIATPPTDD